MTSFDPRNPAGSRPGPGSRSAPAPATSRRRPVRLGRRQAEVAELGSQTDRAPSDGYVEVERLRERARVIRWEPVGSERLETLSFDQWTLIEALYDLRLLSGGQIQREFLASAGENRVRRELSQLRAMGLIQRGWLSGPKGDGRGTRIYILAKRGFALLRDDPGHPASGRWPRPALHTVQPIVHDLARNEWLFAFRSLAPLQLLDWRGPRTGKLEVPLVRRPNTAPLRPLRLGDLREYPPLGLASGSFSDLKPELTLELQLETPTGEQVETDLLVEFEWGNNNEVWRRRARAYDAFLTAWWQGHIRYRFDRRALLFFVVPDARRARRFMKVLDETLQGHLLESPWMQRHPCEEGIRSIAKEVYLGRRSIFVAVARDVHMRTLRARGVSAVPREKRELEASNALARREAARRASRLFQLIDPRELVDPAT